MHLIKSKGGRFLYRPNVGNLVPLRERQTNSLRSALMRSGIMVAIPNVIAMFLSGENRSLEPFGLSGFGFGIEREMERPEQWPRSAFDFRQMRQDACRTYIATCRKVSVIRGKLVDYFRIDKEP